MEKCEAGRLDVVMVVIEMRSNFVVVLLEDVLKV